jgi:hypothetical protein
VTGFSFLLFAEDCCHSPHESALGKCVRIACEEWFLSVHCWASGSMLFLGRFEPVVFGLFSDFCNMKSGGLTDAT